MSEESLYNAMVRHQIYLEGFKRYQGSKFSDTAKALEAEYKRKIEGLEYETLDELTKGQLKKFIQELKAVQRRLYDGYVAKLIEELEEFMSVDYELINDVLDDNTEDDLPTEKKEEPDNLWAGIINEMLPGVGQLLVPFLIGVGLGSIVRFERIVNQAWSNNLTKKQLLDELLGEPLGGKPTVLRMPKRLPTSGKLEDVQVPVPTVGRTGGLIGRVTVENQSAINTALQHIAQQVAQAAMRRRYKRYRWVSVLDNRTTSICRERDGRIYVFGAGPLPPAHINCRSHIVPVIGD